jgi:hypothetical protein
MSNPTMFTTALVGGLAAILASGASHIVPPITGPRAEQRAVTGSVEVSGPSTVAALSGDTPSETASNTLVPWPKRHYGVRVMIADLPFGGVEEQCGECEFAWCDGGAPGHVSTGWPRGSESQGDGWHPMTCFAGSCEVKHPETGACCCKDDCTGTCREACEHEPDPYTCEQQCFQSCFPECMEDPEWCPEGEPGGFAEMWWAVRSGIADAGEIAASRRNVELNAERRALQLIGCNGLVVAHIPLPVRRID